MKHQGTEADYWQVNQKVRHQEEGIGRDHIKVPDGHKRIEKEKNRIKRIEEKLRGGTKK